MVLITQTRHAHGLSGGKSEEQKGKKEKLKGVLIPLTKIIIVNILVISSHKQKGIVLLILFCS